VWVAEGSGCEPGPKEKNRRIVGWSRKEEGREIRRFPGLLVEAAGQLFHGFRRGLDYAFILSPGCGACYSPMNSSES